MHVVSEEMICFSLNVECSHFQVPLSIFTIFFFNSSALPSPPHMCNSRDVICL